MRQLVLTTAQRMTFSQMEPFFRTLLTTHYAGDVVVFTHRVRRSDRIELQKNGAIVVPVLYSGRGLKQPLAPLWPIVRNLASLAGLSVSRSLSRFVLPWFYIRHLFFLEWVLKHRADYDHVFATDCRDVVFQDAPFAWRLEDGVHLFLEDERKPIGDCEHHQRWLASQFGHGVLESLAKKPRSCAGTVMGDTGSMIDYWQTMLSAMWQVHTVREYDGDQGIHNYIIHRGLLGKALPHPWWDGPVQTIGAQSYADLSKDATGNITSRDGRLVPILHQYDRIPELKERFSIAT